MIALCAFNLKVLAQSGSVPPDPDPSAGGQSSGGTAPADPTPEPVVSIPAEPVSVPAPRFTKPKPPTPKPEPVVGPLVIAEIPVAEEVVPVAPEEDNLAFPIIGGALALFGLGFLGFQINKNNKNKQEKKDDPCAGIKAKRDAKNTELVQVIGEVSLQEVLVEKLKGKMEKEAKERVIEKTKDSILGAVGSASLNKVVKLAQKGKDVYEKVNEKYEKANEILEVLKQKKQKLAVEVESLETACKKCMRDVGSSALIDQGVKLGVLLDNHVQKSNLLFLRKPKENRILLAMKKRGFGAGKWNGVGGKLDNGETVMEAMIREAEEEIGVKIKSEDLEEVAINAFSFQDKKEWNQVVHVFFTDKWEGEPIETEEMNPKWFDQDTLPYEDMWITDPHWLPRVLVGERIKASFLFNKDGGEILEMKIEKI